MKHARKTDQEVLRLIFGGDDPFAQYRLREAMKKSTRILAFKLRVRIEEVEKREANGELMQMIEEVAIRRM
ncbi:MAG TPA: hypothetical protein VJH67_03195 [Candidatus Paceibacterota bacterium]